MDGKPPSKKHMKKRGRGSGGDGGGRGEHVSSADTFRSHGKIHRLGKPKVRNMGPIGT